MLKTTNRISRPKDYSKISNRFDNYDGDIIEPQEVQINDENQSIANNYRSLTYRIDGLGVPSTESQTWSLGRRFKITNMRFNGARNPADASTYTISFDGEIVGTGTGRTPTVGGIGTLTDVTGIFLDSVLSDDAVLTFTVNFVNTIGYVEFRLQGFFID